MPTPVSVEAVRQQLEQMGRGNVPKELIANFLSDLGVSPVTEEEESAYKDDFEECSSSDLENEEIDVYRSKATGLFEEITNARTPEYKTASPKRLRPKTSPDSPLMHYCPEGRMRGERGLSARSSNVNVSQQPEKTDRVARYQRTQMSWKSCTSVQNGTKRRPAQNFHKLFAAQHAQAARKTKKAVQNGRKKKFTPDYVTPDLKRRDNVRWEVRQSLRHTSD